MRPFYESQFHFQEGWSSLQTRSCSLSNTHRGLTLQTGTLANLRARTTLKMCSKNLQVAPNCGSWAKCFLRCRLRTENALEAFSIVRRSSVTIKDGGSRIQPSIQIGILRACTSRWLP